MIRVPLILATLGLGILASDLSEHKDLVGLIIQVATLLISFFLGKRVGASPPPPPPPSGRRDGEA